VRAVEHRIESPRAWGYSDDGEMMLSLAESLCVRREVDEAHLLHVLATRHDPARGYGKGARAAFRVHLAGGSWRDAARALWSEGSRGNGGAVRVAPLAVHSMRLDEIRVAELARRSAAPTHGHADGRDGAAVVAVAVHRALRGAPPRCLAVDLDQLARGRFAERIRAIDPGLAPREAATTLGTAVLAAESVPAALWAVVGSTSFTDAVIRAVGLGGDTDSIGAMAGAIAGGAYGAAEIPRGWLDALESGVVDRVDGLLERLAP